MNKEPEKEAKTGGAPQEPEKKEAPKQPEQKQPEQKKETKPLTQEEFNKVYGEMKTAKEKEQAEKDKRLQLEGELFKLKQQAPPEPPTVPEGRQIPKSKEEWEDWNAEDPFAAQQWLSAQTYYQQTQQSNIQQAQNASRAKIRAKHPDMYDANGNFDIKTEKGRIFDRIASEDPNVLFLSNGPELVAARMELEMASKVRATAQAQVDQEKAQQEAARQQKVEQAFVPTGGANPPVQAKVDLSDQEKIIARKMRLSDEEYSKYKNAKYEFADEPVRQRGRR